jgi:hypothetical protein
MYDPKNNIYRVVPIGYNNYPANRFINTSSSSWKSVDESYINWETNTMYPRVTISRPVIGKLFAYFFHV